MAEPRSLIQILAGQPQVAQFEVPKQTPEEEAQLKLFLDRDRNELFDFRESQRTGGHLPVGAALISETTEDFLARQVGQKELAQERLSMTERRRLAGAEGGPPSTALMLDPLQGGDPSLGLFESGRDPMSIPEAVANLRLAYPEGELRVATGTPESFFNPLSKDKGKPVLLWRANGTEPWSRVDPKTGVTFKNGEVVNDVIELFGSAWGAFTGELVVAARGGVIGAGKMIARRGPVAATKSFDVLGELLRYGRGAIFGDLVQEAEQSALQTQRETGPQVMSGAIGAGLVAFAGGAVIEGATRTFGNVVTGRGLFRTAPGMADQMRFAREQGLPTLPTSIVANSPVIQRLGRQAGVLSSVNKDRIDFVRAGLADVLDEFKVTTISDAADVTVEQLINLERREAENLIRILRRNSGWDELTTDKPLTEAGEALHQGLASWNLVNDGLEAVAYDRARGIEIPEYNVQALAQAMPEIRSIAGGITRPEESTTAAMMIADLDAMFGRTAGEAVPPNQPGFETVFRAGAGEAPRPTYRLEARVIPGEAGGPGTTISPTEQLTYLAREAGRNSTPQQGNPSGPLQALATRIRQEIQKVLDNPANTSDEFTAAWNHARSVSRNIMNQEDDIFWKQLVSSTRPGGSDINQIVAELGDLTDPLNINRWDMVERSMSLEAVAFIKDRVVQDAMRNPATLNELIVNARPQILNRLLTKGQQVALKQYSDDWNRLMQVGMQRATQRQATVADVFGEVMGGVSGRPDNNSIAQMLGMVKRSPGGTEGVVGRYFQAGIIDWVVGRVVRDAEIAVEGTARVDGPLLARIFAQLRTSGALEFLTKEQRAMLSNSAKLEQVLKKAQDPGTSITGAATVEQLASFRINAVYTIVRALGIGRAMTWAPLSRWLVGTGKQRIPANQLTVAAGAVLSTMADDEQNAAQKVSEIVSYFGGKAVAVSRGAVDLGRGALNTATGRSVMDLGRRALNTLTPGPGDTVQ